VLTAGRAFTKSTSNAEPIPQVATLSEMRSDGVVPRRGQMTMIAGIPGTGKSAFAMWWVAQLGLSTLYFSADMDSYTANSRLAAIHSGNTVKSVEQAMDTGMGMEYYADALAESKFIFCFDSGPTLEDVGAELAAHVEVFDEYPEVIVIDNVMNIQGSEDYQGQQHILSELHSLARITRAWVVVLHHASEVNGKSPFDPPPRKEIKNKITEHPELVLTVAANPATGDYKVACVKNRSDKSDPGAQYPYTYRADLARCSFHKYVPPAPVPDPEWTPTHWADD